jgi:hypothetical protein
MKIVLFFFIRVTDTHTQARLSIGRILFKSTHGNKEGFFQMLEKTQNLEYVLG